MHLRIQLPSNYGSARCWPSPRIFSSVPTCRDTRRSKQAVPLSHVRRLQARVRANGAALASLNSESEMVSQQEQLVGACVELHREAAAVKEDADETEAALVASPPRVQALRSISTNATPSTAKRNPVHVHVDISSCRTVLDDASPRRSGPCPGSYLDLEPLDLLAAGGMSPL
jgi:hypothetical protein